MAKKIVMIADDEQLVRSALARFLEMSGYEVILANDGNEARSKLLDEKKNGRQIDLLLLDLRMPHMGPQIDDFKDLITVGAMPPVLAITGMAKSSAAPVEHACGIHYLGVLQKPFVPSELLEKLQEILGGA